MATTGLLSSLLLAALGVTAAAFALHHHFAANAQLSAPATVAAPSQPAAVRSRTRFVLLDARQISEAAAKAKAVKPRVTVKDKQRPQPQAQKAALPWPLNLLQ